nr:MAG TPA: hypothetical protein [Caudoviricetes sp.]
MAQVCIFPKTPCIRRGFVLYSHSRGVENLFKAESHRYCDIFTSIVSLPGCLFR